MLSWPFTMTSVPCGAATSASYIHKPLYSCNVLDYVWLQNDHLSQWMFLQNAYIRVFWTKCGRLENIGDICICSTRWAFPQRPTTALKVQLTSSDPPPLWKTPHVCNKVEILNIFLLTYYGSLTNSHTTFAIYSIINVMRRKYYDLYFFFFKTQNFIFVYH